MLNTTSERSPGQTAEPATPQGVRSRVQRMNITVYLFNKTWQWIGIYMQIRTITANIHT